MWPTSLYHIYKFCGSPLCQSPWYNRTCWLGVRQHSGLQERSRGGRWSWTLKLAQKRSWAYREVELCERWTSFASGCSSRAVQRTLSSWLCPARQLKQQLHSALVAAQWWGDTAVTPPLFWRRSMVSPVLFGRYPRSSLHSLVLFPPCPRP